MPPPWVGLVKAKPARDGLGRFLQQHSQRSNLFRGDSSEWTAHAHRANNLACGVENRRGNATGAQNSFFIVERVALEAGLHQFFLQLGGLGGRTWSETPIAGRREQVLDLFRP